MDSEEEDTILQNFEKIKNGKLDGTVDDKILDIARTMVMWERNQSEQEQRQQFRFHAMTERMELIASQTERLISLLHLLTQLIPHPPLRISASLNPTNTPSAAENLKSSSSLDSIQTCSTFSAPV